MERFATDRKYLKKVLLIIFLLDVILHILYLFFILNRNLISFIHNFVGDILLCYLLPCGGVLPCYLFFLLWYKLTHRNKTEIAQNSVFCLFVFNSMDKISKSEI